MTATAVAADRHVLVAVSQDGRRFVSSETFTSWHAAVDSWYRHDDARIAGERPHVRFYAVRSASDPDWHGSIIDPVMFRDSTPAKLNDRQRAVLAAIRELRASGVRRPNSMQVASAIRDTRVDNLVVVATAKQLARKGLVIVLGVDYGPKRYALTTLGRVAA